MMTPNHMDWLRDSHIWKEFEPWLLERRQRAYRNLAHCEIQDNMYRYQGEIRMLDELLKMREKAKNG